MTLLTKLKKKRHITAPWQPVCRQAESGGLPAVQLRGVLSNKN
jgi:hypothetical protein